MKECNVRLQILPLSVVGGATGYDLGCNLIPGLRGTPLKALVVAPRDLQMPQLGLLQLQVFLWVTLWLMYLV